MPRNDGKYLESNVENYFNSKRDPEIMIHRLNDSGAARNLTAAQPGDFLLAIKPNLFLLECKSIKHKYRLPKFSQHARMNRWEMAGVQGVLLVHHSVDDFYRVVRVSQLPIGQPSFDLEAWRPLTFEQAMEIITSWK